MSSSAWAFCVVSSGKQEDTVVDQEAWARATSAANGWAISRVFADVSSGKLGVRKLLARLVSELRATPPAERPERVLMLRLDRVGRGRLADSLVVLHELGELGVTVHTRDGDEILDEPMKELFAAVKLVTASQENLVRRDKSLAFHARKRAAGEFGSIPPYGFVFLEKRLAVYEPEAAIVRALYEKRVAGIGYRRLSIWAANNAPAKIRPNGEFRSLSWGTSTVTKILSNPRYRGTIVPEILWADVAALRGKLVERTTRWPWPLRGAVRCVCGAQLFGEASGHERRRTRYYVCRRVNAHGGRSPHHHAARMEAQFVELLRRLEIEPGLRSKRKAPNLTTLRQRKASLARTLTSVERRRSRAWELAEDESIPRAELADRLADLTAESEKIAEALRSVERELVAAEQAAVATSDLSTLFRNLPELWPRLPVPSQRDIARAIGGYLGGFWADLNRAGVLLVDRDESEYEVDASYPHASPSAIGAQAELIRELAAYN